MKIFYTILFLLGLSGCYTTVEEDLIKANYFNIAPVCEGLSFTKRAVKRNTKEETVVIVCYPSKIFNNNPSSITELEIKQTIPLTQN